MIVKGIVKYSYFSWYIVFFNINVILVRKKRKVDIGGVNKFFL